MKYFFLIPIKKGNKGNKSNISMVDQVSHNETQFKFHHLDNRTKINNPFWVYTN